MVPIATFRFTLMSGRSRGHALTSAWCQYPTWLSGARLRFRTIQIRPIDPVTPPAAR
jgi:hypothetical protein